MQLFTRAMPAKGSLWFFVVPSYEVDICSLFDIRRAFSEALKALVTAEPRAGEEALRVNASKVWKFGVEGVSWKLRLQTPSVPKSQVLV